MMIRAISLLVVLSAASADELRLLWGLPDAVAYVGALMEYEIPETAFEGHITRFEVQTVLDEPMPEWLSFDPSSKTLRGVPAQQNIGPMDLKIMAFGDQESMTGDAFTIIVKEETIGSRLASVLSDKVAAHSPDRPSSTPYCDKGTPEIVFSLVLQDPASSLVEKGATERVDVLRSVSNDFSVPLKDVRLYDREYVKELKRSLLRGGKGNVRVKAALGQLMVSWPIACGTSLDPTGNAKLAALIKHLEKSQVKIASWNIATHLLPETRRRRSMFNFLKTTSPSTPRQTKPTQSTSTTTTPRPIPEVKKTKPTPKPGAVNRKPERNFDLDSMQCKAGTYCSFTIPDDLFTDEDGSVKHLNLILEPINKGQKQPWIMFDSKHNVIEALAPPSTDNSFQYRVTATDSMGESESAVFQIRVTSDDVVSNILHEFSVTLNQDYKEWTKDGKGQVAFLKRLTSYLGSGDATDVITLTSLTSGSVVMKWKNNTLTSEYCNRELVEQLASKLVNKDKSVSSQLLDHMKKYKVVNASFEFLGKCKSYIPTGTDRSGATTSVPATSGKAPTDGSSFYTTAIPIIVIVVLIVVAAIVAICLYRKSKKGKKPAGSPPDRNQAYMTRGGKPVVFPGEVSEPNDDRNATMTTPMLVKEERPPLSAADYPPTNTGGVSTFGKGSGDIFNNGAANVGQSPLYQPPPNPAQDAPPGMNGHRSPRPRTSTPQNARNPVQFPP